MNASFNGINCLVLIKVQFWNDIFAFTIIERFRATFTANDKSEFVTRDQFLS